MCTLCPCKPRSWTARGSNSSQRCSHSTRQCVLLLTPLLLRGHSIDPHQRIIKPPTATKVTCTWLCQAVHQVTGFTAARCMSLCLPLTPHLPSPPPLHPPHPRSHPHHSHRCLRRWGPPSEAIMWTLGLPPLPTTRTSFTLQMAIHCVE